MSRWVKCMALMRRRNRRRTERKALMQNENASLTPQLHQLRQNYSALFFTSCFISCVFFTRDEVDAQTLLKMTYIALKKLHHLNNTLLETPAKWRECHLLTWFIDMTQSHLCRTLCFSGFLVISGSWKEHILHLLKHLSDKTQQNFPAEVKILQLVV